MLTWPDRRACCAARGFFNVTQSELRLLEECDAGIGRHHSARSSLKKSRGQLALESTNLLTQR